jgi:hypothetical protein
MHISYPILDKLLVHLENPEHGKKHKLAVPHEMKNLQQLRAVFVRLEVARATHTLSLHAKHEGQFKEEIAKFIQADEKVDNYKGEKGTAKKLAGKPKIFIDYMIRCMYYIYMYGQSVFYSTVKSLL